MQTLITTYTLNDKNTIKLLYGVLGSRVWFISQDYDSERLRKLAHNYKGFDGFELRSGRGRILEKWEYLNYGKKETIRRE